VISFPNVKAGQAIISAIAIGTKKRFEKPANQSSQNIQNLVLDSYDKTNRVASWLDINSKQFSDADVVFTELPAELFGADYVQFSSSSKNKGSFTVKEESTIFILVDSKIKESASLSDYKKIEERAKNSNRTEFLVYTKKVKKGEKILFDNSQSISTIAVPIYYLG
jgi:hypothetical protein